MIRLIKSKIPHSTKIKIESCFCWFIKNLFKTLQISYLGYKVFFPAKDNSAARIYFRYLLSHSWSHENFEQNIVKALLLKHMESSQFIDGGANYGLYSLLAASVPTVKKVYAIECSSETVHWLKKTITYNHLENKIQCIHAAIAANSGEMHYVRSSNNSEWTQTCKVSELDQAKHSNETIKSIQLDDLIFNQMDLNDGSVFIKLDLEGNDRQAFQGLNKLFASNIDYVILTEMHTGLFKTEESVLQYAQELWNINATGVYDLHVHSIPKKIMEIHTLTQFCSLLKEYIGNEFPLNLTNILLSKRKLSPELLTEIR